MSTKTLVIVFLFLIGDLRAFDVDKVVDKAMEEIIAERRAKFGPDLVRLRRDIRRMGAKLTDESVAMDIQNEFLARAVDIASMDTEGGATTEIEALGVIEKRVGEKFNKGGAAGGQSALVQLLELAQFTCGLTEFSLKCGDDPYRTMSGVCNNRRYFYWGATSIPFRRVINPSYADGISVPRGGIVSSSLQSVSLGSSSPNCLADPTSHLPNPRLVSNTFLDDQNPTSDKLSHIFTIISQFLDHDITFTPEFEFEKPCCPFPNAQQLINRECFPIETTDIGEESVDGPYGRKKRQAVEAKCLEFKRSAAFCPGTSAMTGKPREQMNGISAYVDGSNIYSSNPAHSMILRTNDEGLMNVTVLGNGKEFLPIADLDGDGEFQHSGGDVRARENPGLLSLHTLFLREHNRVARQMINYLGNDDEKIYQETRRIVIAEWQQVVFGQYLHSLLDSTVAWNLDLWPSFNSEYDSTLDASIANSFSTAAYRFGHSMVKGVFAMLMVESTGPDSFKLRDEFFEDPRWMADGGFGVEQIIKGLFTEGAASYGPGLTDDIRNLLFGGLDLAALNINRGRDHGIPSYSEFREACGLARPCSWDQRPSSIPESRWETLEELYNDPDDIDLFPGGLAEKSEGNGVLGETFSCLVGEQFRRLKFGDRYFFTHVNSNSRAMSINEMAEINKRNLAAIICDNTDIEVVREDVFRLDSQMIKCEELRQLAALDVKIFAEGIYYGWGK